MKTKNNQTSSTTFTSTNSQDTERSSDVVREKSELIYSNENVGEKIQDFSELLNQLEDLDDKKKQLWKEIYNNAVTDRQNSFVMFKELYELVDGKSSEHAVHAKSMTSYLERMAKCNDQLIKLAELIAEAQRSEKSIDSDSMYEQIMMSSSTKRKQ